MYFCPKKFHRKCAKSTNTKQKQIHVTVFVIKLLLHVLWEKYVVCHFLLADLVVIVQIYQYKVMHTLSHPAAIKQVSGIISLFLKWKIWTIHTVSNANWKSHAFYCSQLQSIETLWNWLHFLNILKFLKMHYFSLSFNATQNPMAFLEKLSIGLTLRVVAYWPL